MHGSVAGVIAVLLVHPCAVAAQDRPLPARHAEIELAGYADCVVGRKANHAGVFAFLRVQPDSQGFYPAAMKAADMRCLDAAARRQGTSKLEMRLQPMTFREALFPALYRARFAQASPAARIPTAPPMAYSTEFDGAATLPLAYRAGRALGDCVARAAPDAAHALLLARPYSRQEDAAVGLLRPAIAQCLTEKQTVRLSRSSLRAHVGEATYRLAVATG